MSIFNLILQLQYQFSSAQHIALLLKYWPNHSGILQGKKNQTQSTNYSFTAFTF